MNFGTFSPKFSKISFYDAKFWNSGNYKYLDISSPDLYRSQNGSPRHILFKWLTTASRYSGLVVRYSQRYWSSNVHDLTFTWTHSCGNHTFTPYSATETILKNMGNYSISQEICIRFCCALLCCGYAIVHNEFTWSIYPYSSGLLCWHWGNT